MKSISTELTSNQYSTVHHLRTLHQQILSDNYNNNESSLELVEILGGIDSIVAHYISISNKNNFNNPSLNSSQIENIHEILSKNYNNINKNNLIRDMDGNGLTISLEDIFETNNTPKTEIFQTNNRQITDIFEPNNNYLNILFGLNIGPKVHQIIYHKVVMFANTLILIYAVSLLTLDITGIFSNYECNVTLVVSYIFIIYIMVWLILVIVSVNEKAIHLIIHSFEFWLKFYYAMVILIMNIINTARSYEQYVDVYIGQYYLLRVDELLIIITFSIMDGLQWHLKSKIMLGFGIATYYSIRALYGFFCLTDNEDTMIYISNGISIKALSVISTAYRVLSIFIWKQLIMSCYKKNKATIINYSPNIKWQSTQSGEYIISSDNVCTYSFTGDN